MHVTDLFLFSLRLFTWVNNSKRCINNDGFEPWGTDILTVHIYLFCRLAFSLHWGSSGTLFAVIPEVGVTYDVPSRQGRGRGQACPHFGGPSPPMFSPWALGWPPSAALGTFLPCRRHPGTSSDAFRHCACAGPRASDVTSQTSRDFGEDDEISELSSSGTPGRSHWAATLAALPPVFGLSADCTHLQGGIQGIHTP